MIKHYQMTVLEMWIEELYERIGITDITLLNIDDLARRLNIWVYYNPMKSKGLERLPGMYTMNIDSRLSPTKQWLAFLHESCHLLRHVGNQTVLPTLFTKAQEEEAEQFVLYAAMPISMISKLHMPERRDKAIEYLSRTFAVPKSLAERRLDQIERREYQGAMDSLTARTIYRDDLITSEVKPIIGVSIYAYYDSNADIPGPSQLVIAVDSQTMNNELEYSFSIDERFERLETEDFYGYKYTHLFASDLRYKNDQIVLNFPTLALKYGKAGRRFVIQMNELETFVRFERGYF